MARDSGFRTSMKTPTLRDDVWFKVPLARDLLLGRTTRFASLMYAEHLFHWNRFYEESPRKIGLQQYLTHFSDLAQSMATSGGFDARFNPMPVTRSGVALDGSHRMALHTAARELRLGWTQPTTDVKNAEPPSYGWDYFHNKGVHQDVLIAAITQKVVSDAEHVPMLLIWPRAMEYEAEIWKVLQSALPAASISIHCQLNSVGIQNVVTLAYRDESWAQKMSGIARKASREAGSNQSDASVSVVPLPWVSQSDLKDLKQDIRRIWHEEFQGVHTSDTRPESIRIWTSLSSVQSVAGLNTIPPKKYHQKIREFGPLAETSCNLPFGPSSMAVSGSQWLDLRGIRSSRDVDLISDEDLLTGVEFSHNEYLPRFGISPTEILYDPDKHIWLFGLKFLSPDIYLYIMSIRNESKDRAFINCFSQTLARVNRDTEWKVRLQAKNAAIPQSQPILQSTPWTSSDLYASLYRTGGQLYEGPGHGSRRRAASWVGSLRWRGIASVERVSQRIPKRLVRLIRRLIRDTQGP